MLGYCKHYFRKSFRVAVEESNPRPRVLSRDLSLRASHRQSRRLPRTAPRYGVKGLRAVLELRHSLGRPQGFQSLAPLRIGSFASRRLLKGIEERQTHFLASPAVSSSHRSPVEGLRFPLGCSVQEPWGSSPHACRQTHLDASWMALQPQGVIIPVPFGKGLPAGFQTGDLTSKERATHGGLEPQLATGYPPKCLTVKSRSTGYSHLTPHACLQPERDLCR